MSDTLERVHAEFVGTRANGTEDANGVGADPQSGESYEYLEADIFDSDENRTEFVNWVLDEISRTAAERERLEQDWETWRRQVAARPESETKDWPWENAANVATPLMATNVNGIYAQVRDVYAKRKPLFRATAASKDKAAHAKAVSRFLNKLVESPFHLDIQRKNDDIFRDAVLMGTEFVEVPWRTVTQSFKRKGEGGGVEQVRRTTYDGPDVQPLRIEDVYAPLYQSNVQDMAWIALAKGFDAWKLRELEATGFFQNTDVVVGALETKDTDAREAEREVMHYGGSLSTHEHSGIARLFKVYAKWDVDGDGFVEEIIAWVHEPTKTLLRAEFNEAGWKMVARIPYLGNPGQLYATGVGHLLTQIQQEMDTLHNMRLNSLSLSSLQMLAVREGSNVHPQEKMYPLKIFRLMDPQGDIRPMVFPDVSDGTLAAEQFLKLYAERSVGASEARLGQPDTVAKSGTSGSLQRFLSEQGNRIFNAIIDSIERGYSEIGMMLLMQLVTNSDRVMMPGGLLEQLVDREDYQLVAEVLSLNVEDLPSRFRFYVSTTDVTQTREARRQMLMLQKQLYSMYVKEAFSMVQVMESPQATPGMREFGQKMFVGMSKMLEEELRLLEVDDTGDYVPYTEHLEFLQEVLDGQKQQQLEMMKQQMGGMLDGGEDGRTRGIAPAGGGTGVGAPMGGVGGGTGGDGMGERLVWNEA